jgi:hypothetical protein
MRRISIAGVLGVVAVFAVGLAALIQATNVWLGAMFALTIGLLMASVLATFLRGWRSGVWLGFALFGWGYLLVGNVTGLNLGSHAWLLSDAVAGWVFSTSNPAPVEPPILAYTPEYETYRMALLDYKARDTNALMIGRWLWLLLIAYAGAILGAVLARTGPTGGTVRP